MSDHSGLKEAIRLIRAEADDLDRAAVGSWHPRALTLRAVADAAESTLSVIRIVGQYYVEYATRVSPEAGWYPGIFHADSIVEAERKAAECRNRPHEYRCVRVTGPHRRELPA